jgi:hypothetical protein
MNQYDEINTFLQSEAHIASDYEFLMSYINTFLYKNLNREKVNEFYKKIPAICDKLFGVSIKTGKSKPNLKISEVDLLNKETATFQDFDALLNLLEPGIENLKMKFKNLFFSINNPPEYVPHYTLPASILSKSINSLLVSKKTDYVLSLCFFNCLTKNLDVQRMELERGSIHTNLFEYYITLLLVVIKEYPMSVQHKVSLGKSNKNFEVLKNNISAINKKAVSEKSKENYSALDYNRSLIFNFYTILFKNILQNFSKSRHISDLAKLKLIVSGIETIWLSDFFMPPPNFLPTSSIDIYSYFFRKNTNFTDDGFSSRAFTYENVLAQNLYSFNIPNMMVIQCMTNVINILHENFLFNTKKQITLDKDSMLFILQKPLFFFLKNCFYKISEGTSNSEVNLGDIAKLWHSYVTPWRFVPKESFLDYADAITEFIFLNILFYTELFNDYIIAFNSVNVLNKNEINLLNEIMEMYNISTQDDIIYDHLNLRLLLDLSMGKVFVKLFYNILIFV